MKKLISSGFVAAVGLFVFVSTPDVQAADRCAGLVPDSLIQSESVSDMYFDMRLAELQCHYVQKDQTVLNNIATTINDFKTRYAPCIKGSQDALVKQLGGENTFDNFYAKLGNQIVLLNIDDPCGRALSLAQAMMKAPMKCGAEMADAYAPWFESLDQAYKAKTGDELHRICDKTDPAPES